MVFVRNENVNSMNQRFRNSEFLMFGVMEHVVKISVGVSGFFVDVWHSYCVLASLQSCKHIYGTHRMLGYHYASLPTFLVVEICLRYVLHSQQTTYCIFLLISRTSGP